MSPPLAATKPFVLPGLPGLPIPGSKVDLLIKIDGGSRLNPACVPPPNIASLNNAWRRFSLPEIVHWGTLHFQGLKIAKGANETTKQARMRRCWQEFVDYNPRAVTVNGRERLVVDKHANPDEQRRFSEIIGEAIGVAIVGKALPAGRAAFTRRSFNRTTRHDYDISTPTGIVWLETRGRYGGGGRSKAMLEVDRKFNRKHKYRIVKKKGSQSKTVVTTVGAGDYSQAIAALVYPSDDGNRKLPDVELMDPPGQSRQPARVERARRVLRHYFEIFDRQNVKAMLDIQRLLDLSDVELERELDTGIRLFSESRNYPPKRIAYFGRTSLRVLGEQFVGTYFDGAAAPPWLTQTGAAPAESGIFFYGIWRGVIERLGSFDLLELLSSNADTAVTVTDAGTTFVLFNDGVLTAWSSSIQQLKSDAAG
jgi:hypothetical protein